MRLDIAQELVNCCIELELHPDYSGRGMFGKTTTGIEYEKESDLMIAVAQLAFQIGATPNDEPADITMRELVPELRRMKTDSMGKGMIAY